MADRVEVTQTQTVGRPNDDDRDKASGGLDKVSGGVPDVDVSDVSGGDGSVRGSVHG